MAHRPGALVLRREDDGQILCERCVLADTFWRRLRGLLGRRELEPGEGLVLRPSWSVHTFFMPFAIDVIFADADQVVTKVVRSLQPGRVVACRGARDVIELRAGECARLGLAEGDRLAWAAQSGRSPGAVPRSVDGHRPDSSPSDEVTRVLLSTGDDRFLRLARFLLTRNRFEVEATKRLAKTVELVERHRPDIVVIDAMGSFADAARAVAAMEALHPDVAVMVIFDGERPPWTTGLSVTEKWDALETLPHELRRLVGNTRRLS